MSSLLQFGGEIGKKGVRLEFVKSYIPWEECHQFCKPQGGESVPCSVCNEEHPQIYVAWRKPKGMCGQYVVFQYNGELKVPDLSIPIDVEKLPRDARPLSPEENSQAWHRK